MSLLWNRFLCSAVGTCRRYINITAVRLVANVDDSLTESVLWVPRNVGFRVIGRGGESLNDLSMKTNSRINVDLNTVRGRIPITIRGTAEACADARETIERIQAEVASQVAQSETTVWIPKIQGGVIIGKGGAMVKSLRQDTGAQIGVQRDLMKDGLIPVIIRGSPENIEDAKQRIEQLLASDNASGTTVWVAEKQLGLIIGKGGATIKALSKTTGVYIVLDKAGIKDGFVPVTLKGEVQHCTAAKERIDELLSESLQ